jgi:tetratricopeptide (TPR) repeat protein
MFWPEEELNREELVQRFEAEAAEGGLGFYSFETLAILFEYYLEAQDLSKAQLVLSHTSRLYPQEPRIYLLYSYLSDVRKRYIEAHAYIQKAFHNMPPDRAVYEQYIGVVTRLGRYEEALWLLESYAEAFPEVAGEIWRYGVEVLWEADAWEAALRTAWRGLEVAPMTDLYFWLRLVRAYESGDALAGGLADFWQAIWEAPSDYRLWLGLAYLYERKFAYHQAQDALAEVEKLFLSEEEVAEDWWAVYYYILARVYEGKGDKEAAFRAYLWVRHHRPQVVSALIGIIRYYHGQGRWSEAEPHLRMALRLAGERPTVQAVVAEHLWAQGEWRLAARFYEVLLRRPKYGEVAMERLLMHYAAQCARKALWRVLRKGGPLFADRPWLWLRWSEQAFHRGEVLFAWYIVDFAVETFGQRSWPGAVYFWHAGLAWRLGHRRQAAHSLEKALLRDATQSRWFLLAMGESAMPLAVQHLLKRYKPSA